MMEGTERQVTDINWLAGWADYHHKEAKAGARAVDARKAYLKEYCRQNNYTEDQARNKFIIDWELQDALDKWSLHEREAKRLDSLVQRRCAQLQLQLALEHNRPRVPQPRHPVEVRP